MRELGTRPKKSRHLVKIIVLTFFLTIVTIVLIKLFNLEKIVFKGPTTVVQLITNTGLASDNNRINVLVLGIGGQGHDGPNLSDTMILASIDKEGKDVALVSIPRDLWVPSVSAKINSVYAYGQEKNQQGLSLTAKTVVELLGLPVHYAIRVDFNGFIKAIDLVDGLDVNVENSFTDPKFPIAGKEDDTCGLVVETQQINGTTETIVKDATGSATVVTDQNDPFTCRYETISYTKGLTHMDGVTTLKFIRSRHGTNNEGSDFARSARQQSVILAFRLKVLSSQTFLDPKTIIDLVSTFGNSIDTNITSEEVPYFVKLGQKIEPSIIRRIVLDQGRDDSVLEAGDLASHGGQFVLVPKNNNWTDLAEYIQGEIFKLKEK